MERCWIEKCINKLLTTERGEYAVATIWQPCAFMRLMIALKERIAMHSVRRYSALTLIGLLPLASLPNSVAERAKLLVQTGAGLIGSSSENPKWLRNKSDYVVTYPFQIASDSLLHQRNCNGSRGGTRSSSVSHGKYRVGKLHAEKGVRQGVRNASIGSITPTLLATIWDDLDEVERSNITQIVVDYLETKRSEIIDAEQ